MKNIEKSFVYLSILMMNITFAIGQGSSGSDREHSQIESAEKQVVRIGTSADISKSGQNIGKTIRSTLTKVFQEVNDKGGIQGVTFEYTFLDDEYNPEIAHKNFLKFANELNTDIILAPFGTVTTRESFNLMKENKLSVFFPATTESTLFRNAELKNLVNLTASYDKQGKVLIDYIFKKRKPNKIALFYQDDAFGKDGMTGAKDELLKHNFTNIVELPYERNLEDFSKQVKIIKQEEPDVIGLFSVPIQAKRFLEELEPEYVSKQLLFGISDLQDEDLQKYIKDHGLSFIYANSLPDWHVDSLKLVEDYKKFCAVNAIKPDPFSFEIYVIGQLFLYLVERVKGPVTKEKIMQEAERIKNLNFKGLKLNFDPETRALIDFVRITENIPQP